MVVVVIVVIEEVLQRAEEITEVEVMMVVVAETKALEAEAATVIAAEVGKLIVAEVATVAAEAEEGNLKRILRCTGEQLSYVYSYTSHAQLSTRALRMDVFLDQIPRSRNEKTSCTPC